VRTAVCCDVLTSVLVQRVRSARGVLQDVRLVPPAALPGARAPATAGPNLHHLSLRQQELAEASSSAS